MARTLAERQSSIAARIVDGRASAGSSARTKSRFIEIAASGVFKSWTSSVVNPSRTSDSSPMRFALGGIAGAPIGASGLTLAAIQPS